MIGNDKPRLTSDMSGWWVSMLEGANDLRPFSHNVHCSNTWSFVRFVAWTCTLMRPSLPHGLTPIMVPSFKTTSSTLRMSQICRFTERHKHSRPASLRHITKKQVRCSVFEEETAYSHHQGVMDAQAHVTGNAPGHPSSSRMAPMPCAFTRRGWQS